jgi:F-type H+-transporting ATPase subunit b
VVEHGVHEPQVTDLILPAINFAIFAYVLMRFMAGPIREFFRERTERVREGLAAGDRAQREAARLQAQIEQDLRELPNVQGRLKADLLATAEAARASLLAQAREAAERIRADARLVAEQETQTAQRAVRAEIVEEAIRQATALIRDGVKADDQARFVRDFVQSARYAP